jgi:hypothetical protein
MTVWSTAFRLCFSAQAKACTPNPKIVEPQTFALLERILLGEILGALCVLAVNAGEHFHSEGAKDAKKRQGD